jgi:hypothetical protein
MSQTNDSDADGTANRLDDFPHDPAAAVDSDNDGFPDAWNPGQSELTTTSGLVLDAFPNDSACASAAQGPLGSCDIEAALPVYTPQRDDIASDDGGIIYLLGSTERRVFRWSSIDETHENPIVVGSGDPLDLRSPSKMALASESGRIYLGYASGAITYIELDGDPTVEHPHTVLSGSLLNLTPMGQLLHANAQEYLGRTHVVVDATGGMRPVRERIFLNPTGGYSFDRERSRMYYWESSGLRFEAFDLTTGVAFDFGSSASSSELSPPQPIRISPDGERILVGQGDIYEAEGLTRSGGVPDALIDAHWLPDGSVVTLRSAPGGTSSGSLLERRTAALELAEVVDHAGAPLALVDTAAGLVVVTGHESGPRFDIYLPSTD